MMLNPLHQAANEGDIKRVTKLIIEDNYDINTPNFEHNLETPLHLAARKGYELVVSFLISNKADVDAKDKNGLTPLHLACMKGRIDIARRLLEAGADINAQSNMGQTPLHWALFNNHPQVIFSLIARGAVIDNSALCICPDPEIQQIITKHHAIANRSSRRRASQSKTRGYRSKFLHHQRSNDEKELVRLYARANEIVKNQLPRRKIRNADLVKMLQGAIEEKEKMEEFKEQFKVERICEMVCGAQIN